MDITEVRISLTEKEGKRLKAYATITFDNSFVVRNIKIVDGNSGLFVAMPSRRVKQLCSKCSKRIDVGSRYCSYCGVRLPYQQTKDESGQKHLTHQDLAHPINQEYRDYLQRYILEVYYKEKNNYRGHVHDSNRSIAVDEVSENIPDK